MTGARGVTYQGARTRQAYGRWYVPWIGALMERGRIVERCPHKHHKREHAEACARRLEREAVAR